MTAGCRDRGFTLLEILVALVVLGLVLAGLAQGTRFGLSAWATQARVIDKRADLDAVDRTLRRLVERMTPGDAAEPSRVTGTISKIAFRSELPLAGAALPTRMADMQLGVDAAHRLVLRWTLHHHGAQLRPPPPPTETVLLEAVDHLELTYWPADGGAAVGAWERPDLPGLIRFRVVFVPSEKRVWPPLMIAPMRDRAEG